MAPSHNIFDLDRLRDAWEAPEGDSVAPVAPVAPPAAPMVQLFEAFRDAAVAEHGAAALEGVAPLLDRAKGLVETLSAPDADLEALEKERLDLQALFVAFEDLLEAIAI